MNMDAAGAREAPAPTPTAPRPSRRTERARHVPAAACGLCDSARCGRARRHSAVTRPLACPSVLRLATPGQADRTEREKLISGCAGSCWPPRGSSTEAQPEPVGPGRPTQYGPLLCFPASPVAQAAAVAGMNRNGLPEAPTCAASGSQGPSHSPHNHGEPPSRHGPSMVFLQAAECVTRLGLLVSRPQIGDVGPFGPGPQSAPGPVPARALGGRVRPPAINSPAGIRARLGRLRRHSGSRGPRAPRGHYSVARGARVATGSGPAVRGRPDRGRREQRRGPVTPSL